MCFGAIKEGGIQERDRTPRNLVIAVPNITIFFISPDVYHMELRAHDRYVPADGDLLN